MFTVNLETYVISDTHFGHDNIAKYCSRPENHDFKIYNNWQKIIDWEDEIIHLGDVNVWFGVKQKVWDAAIAGLKGHKTLVLGNHDPHEPDFYNMQEFYVRNPFTAEVEDIKKKIHFSHYPVPDDQQGDWDYNFHGHIHNNITDEGGDMPWHVNCSIEVLDYKPIQIGELIP